MSEEGYKQAMVRKVADTGKPRQGPRYVLISMSLAYQMYKTVTEAASPTSTR